MDRKKLPYLQVFNDRHGRERVYFRRQLDAAAYRCALPPLADASFEEAYARALTVDARPMMAWSGTSIS